ncbi:MAG: MBL fold metallo-hydrolase [Emcibacter sp.]|nr:MBL fold metallo-hydrolase [Emcibacter sp.]
MKNRFEKTIKLCLIVLFMGFFSVEVHSKPLEAEFIGNEAFRITDGDYILMIDFPYQSGAYGSMEYDFFFPGTTGKVLSLITHRHLDHFDPILFSEQKWKIVGPKEVTVALARDKVLKLRPNVAFGPIHITPQKSAHGNTEHYSYLVNWHGLQLFFTGDTEDVGQLKNLPELDALFITSWFYRKAKMNDALPETKKIIIYHHKEKDIVPGCSGCIIPVQKQIIDIK